MNKYFDKIYCVNLNSRPDKWLKCLIKFQKLNINVTRFPAYDKDNSFVKDKFFKLISKRLNRSSKSAISKIEEMGCLVSHYKIMEDAIKNNYERILIFEDDVIFHKDFSTRIGKLGELDWDIVCLGASEFARSQLRNMKSDKEYYTPTIATCGTFAYAINKVGMRLAISEFSNFMKPADNHLIDMYPKCRSYVLHPNIVIADVTDSAIRRSLNQESHAKRMGWRIEDYVL